MFCLLYSFVLLYRTFMSKFYMNYVLGDSAPFQTWLKNHCLGEVPTFERHQSTWVQTGMKSHYTVPTVILTLLFRPCSTDIHSTQGSLDLSVSVGHLSSYKFHDEDTSDFLLYTIKMLYFPVLPGPWQTSDHLKGISRWFCHGKSEISRRKGAKIFFFLV